MSRTRKYLYGPVLSRRLGRSLGIDVIPFKTCTYDCVYCQLGHTTNHTVERRAYVPTDEVLSELKELLLAGDRPDIISFAGSGEPTLASNLGEIIRAIKEMTDVPVAVFTNASLLWMPEVRDDLARADIVSPSLDAASSETAEAVNKLAAGLDYPAIYRGIVDFCAGYGGRVWLEILLADGVNDTPRDIADLVRAVKGLANVERVQFNTVCRPPADASVRPVPRERLEEIRTTFPGWTEIIASYPERHSASGRTCTPEDAADLIERHPCTEEGLAEGLGIERADAARLIAALLEQGAILSEERGGSVCYFIRHPQ